MRDKVKKNPGVPLIFLLGDSDIPYALWLYLNCHDMWAHKWKYHEENEETCQGDKNKYVHYNSLRKSSIAKLSDDEKKVYKTYKTPGGRYTEGVVKQSFCEAVSPEGRKMLTKMTSKCCKFLRAIKGEEFTQVWDATEAELHIGESIWGSKSKKRKAAEPLPPLAAPEPSPTSTIVLFPGDPGYDEWRKKFEDDSDSDDEVGAMAGV